MIDKIIDWIIKHKISCCLIVFLAFLFPLIIVHILYSIYAPIEWLVHKWDAGDLLGYVSGFLAFLGTVILGALTLWQNKNLNNINEKLNQENINMQRISIQKLQPFIKISNLKILDTIEINPKDYKHENIIMCYEKVNSDFRDFIADLYMKKIDSLENYKKTIKFEFLNISESIIREIEIQRIEFSGFRSEDCNQFASHEKYKYINDLILPNSTKEITLNIFLDDKKYIDFWEYADWNKIGYFDICIYVKNTTTANIECNQKIYIKKIHTGKEKIIYKMLEE